MEGLAFRPLERGDGGAELASSEQDARPAGQIFAHDDFLPVVRAFEPSCHFGRSTLGKLEGEFNQGVFHDTDVQGAPQQQVRELELIFEELRIIGADS